VDEVRVKLYDILDRGVGDLLVHLAQTEVHDAAVLGVIVGLHHRARRLGRRLVLVDVSPRLDRLLRASRLHRVLARGPGEQDVAVRPVTRAVPPPETGAPFSDAAQRPAMGVPPMVSREPVAERPSEAVAPPTDDAAPVTDDAAPVTDTVLPLTD
jgi:anti-anti-sigma factor